MFIKYEAEVSSRVGGGERGVVDFGKLFTETNDPERACWSNRGEQYCTNASDLYKPPRQSKLRNCPENLP